MMIDLEFCKYVYKDDFDYNFDSVYLSKSCWELLFSRSVFVQGLCQF